MFERQAKTLIMAKAGFYPIIVVLGPRQSGKTTLVKHLFADKPYVSLEDPDVLDFAVSDPRHFLAQYPQGAIFDEVQRAPHLFSYLQGIVDTKKQMGQYILTGSQQFNLLAKITQSLAGRAGLVELLPLTWQECPNQSLSLEQYLFGGAYPAIYDRGVPATMWYSDYIKTYLERDVRQILQVENINTFRKFIRMCAARTGQLLNLSSLASDSGITHNTAKAWLSVLEASYLVHVLTPFHANLNKRLVKSPKLYFHDTGLACYLMNITDVDSLSIHAMRGALFETWVISELNKIKQNFGLVCNFYFWRNSQGHEIDLLIEIGNKTYVIEIKSGKTLNTDFFAGLKYFSGLMKDKSLEQYLVYGGDVMQTRNNMQILPWHAVANILLANQSDLLGND